MTDKDVREFLKLNPDSVLKDWIEYQKLSDRGKFLYKMNGEMRLRMKRNLIHEQMKTSKSIWK